MPIHVGALPWAVKSVHDFFKGRIHPGDVYLLNDPYCGGNHLPDLTAFVPVFDGDRLAFWSINRSHQSDIGGATHGGYNPGATEIWHEGLRVPPLRLYDRGRLIDDVNELLVLNVRHPRDFRGDLAAMIGSARVGERRLQALLAEFGSADTPRGDRGRPRRGRAAGASGDQPVARRGLLRRGDDRRRRAPLQGHPYPRKGDQARQRPRS